MFIKTTDGAFISASRIVLIERRGNLDVEADDDLANIFYEFCGKKHEAEVAWRDARMLMDAGGGLRAASAKSDVTEQDAAVEALAKRLGCDRTEAAAVVRDGPRSVEELAALSLVQVKENPALLRAWAQARRALGYAKQNVLE